MEVKISVIVPIYNTEKYLRKCLDSLVNQTLKDIEIILINDGSPDNSENIVSEYLERYPDKIVYRKKKNEGQGVARNLGIKMAKGEFVSFVDSDDYVDVTIFEKLYKKAVESGASLVSTEGLIEVRNNHEIQHGIEFDDNDEYIKYMLNNSGPVAKIIRKDIIEKNDLYFPKLKAYEDISVVPLWGLNADKISFVNESLYYYLIHEGSTMKQMEYNNKLTHIYDSLDNLYIKFGLENRDKYHDELEWIFIEHLLHAASLRFLKFDKRDEVKKIKNIMREKFPKWNKNRYYNRQSIKYKIVCTLIYNNKLSILKLLLK